MAGHGKWEALGEGSVPVEEMDKGLGHVVSIDNGVLHCINGTSLTFELSEA